MFEDATGLKLTDSNGIKDELPPITTFLNRLLALTIDLQNILFTAFEQLLTARIEGAIASGTYDVGLETLTAESFVVAGRQTIYTHPGTSAETRLLTIVSASATVRSRSMRRWSVSPIPARFFWSTASRAAPPCRFRPEV